MKTKPTTFVLSAVAMLVATMILTSPESLLFETNQALAQEVSIPSDEKTISVTGTATTSVEPDLLVITFGVETQEVTAKQALDVNSQTMTGIIDAIKLTGITEDEINTSRFNIYPVYEGYEDPTTKRWKQDLTGYQVTNTITVETANLALAADIIDGAVTAGANRVDNVSFELSPEKYMQLKDDLIEKAIVNAQTKAENALRPLDYSITGVKAVSLSEFGGFPPPLPMFGMAFDQSIERSFASSPTPVFSSEQDVSTTTNVIFLIGSN